MIFIGHGQRGRVALRRLHVTDVLRFRETEQHLLNATLRAGLRIVFMGESGAEKQLEITVLRMTDERHKFKRMELFKDTVWWVVFLDSASANARHIREYFEKSETPDSDGEFF